MGSQFVNISRQSRLHLRLAPSNCKSLTWFITSSPWVPNSLISADKAAFTSASLHPFNSACLSEASKLFFFSSLRAAAFVKTAKRDGLVARVRATSAEERACKTRVENFDNMVGVTPCEGNHKSVQQKLSS